MGRPTIEFEETVVLKLKSITCGECGTPFAMEAKLYNEKRENGATFYCPNGHARVFRETEADKLKAQLAREAKKREYLEMEVREARQAEEHAERRRRAAKGQLTKLRNQTAQGKCPCCDRYFPDLHEHLTEEHPDYVSQEPEEATDGSSA